MCVRRRARPCFSDAIRKQPYALASAISLFGAAIGLFGAAIFSLFGAECPRGRNETLTGAAATPPEL